MTRWSLKDLTGLLLKNQKEIKADQWEVVEFPAIMDDGAAMWPEYWKREELEKVKATLTGGKMECAMDAITYFRRRSDY